jgi:hypothetical protein
MKTNLCAITLSALSCLAGSALAQPGTELYASGILHQAVGAAQLGPVDGRRLPVHNLGSSGQDGVDIQLNSLYGGGVGVDADPILAAGTVRIRHRGWDGLIYHRFAVTNSPAGAMITADYSGVGAIGVRTVMYGVDGSVLWDNTTPGPIVDNVIPPTCPDGSPGVIWHVHMLVAGSNPPRYVDQFVWSCAVGFNLHGDPYPGCCRTNPVFPAGSPGEPAGIGSMRITSDQPALTIEGDALETYGLEVYGVGQAQIDEECTMDQATGTCDPSVRRLPVRNLGSSGQDGVAIDLGSDVGGFEIEMARGNCCRGHVTLMKAYDDGNAEQRISRTLDDIDPAGVTTETLDADFSSLGASGFIVTCFGTGGVVIGPPGGTAIINGGPRPVWTNRCPGGGTETWINTGTTSNPVWTFVGCDMNTNRMAMPGLVLEGVASYSITPMGGAPQGRLRHVVITKNGSELELRRVTTTPYVGGSPCGTADFDGDGDIGTDADIEAFFACLAGACCPTCDPHGADFNGDGDIGTDADIESFFRVLAGGPC